MRRIAIIVVLFALAGIWGCASTGLFSRTPPPRVIRGKVTLPANARAKSGPPDLSEAIVYVDPIPQTAGASPPTRRSGGKTVLAAHHADPTAVIVAKGDVFSPRVLPVMVGTRVEFRNADRVYHNTFSLSKAKRFDVGNYAPGEHRAVVFDRPGVVELFCGLHPTTAGFLVVLAGPVFARADRSGAFALPALPPGRYVVRYWHPRFGTRKTTVDLTAAADADVRLKF